MKIQFHDLAVLYSLFFKIGLFTIGGGGYAMLPMLKDELVDKRGWLSEQELLDYYAIGQATPGIIAINTATFTGFKKQGIPGAVMATAGMVTPSLIIISLIATFVPKLQENEIVQKAFRGLRAGVAALLLHTLYGLIKKTLTNKERKNIFSIVLILAAFFAVVVGGVSPVIIVTVAGLLGWLVGFKGKVKQQ